MSYYLRDNCIKKCYKMDVKGSNVPVCGIFLWVSVCLLTLGGSTGSSMTGQVGDGYGEELYPDVQLVLRLLKCMYDVLFLFFIILHTKYSYKTCFHQA